MATEQLEIILKSKAEGGGAKDSKKGLDAVTKAAKVAAGAFAALKTAQAAMDFVKVGAGIQRQANALDGLAKAAGSSGREITAAIQGASDHTIDRMTAMSAASKAMMLDVAQTPEQFERLTKVARTLGQAMGQDAAKSIDDFVTAAGRQSMQIADNLGLTIRAEQAYERYARQLGKTADDLTTVEKKQAFLNEMLVEGERKMADMGETGGDLASDFEKVEAAVEDAKAGFAEMAAEVVDAAVEVDELTRRLRGLPTTVEQTVTILRAMGQSTGGVVAWLQKMTIQLNPMVIAFNLVKKQVGETAKAFVELGDLIGLNVSGVLSGLEGKIYGALGATEAFTDAVGVTNRAISEYGGYAARAIDSVSTLGQYQHDVASAYENVTRTSYLAADAVATHSGSQADLERAVLGTIPAVEDWRAAQEEANRVAGEAATQYASMAESLKGASEAQIASQAISQLGTLLDEGKITAEQYSTAVTETQLAFGLADEASINLTNRMLALNARLGEGTVAATAYDEELAHLVEINKMENLQIEKFGTLLADTTVATQTATTTNAGFQEQVDTTAASVRDSQAVIEAHRKKMGELDEAAVAAAAKFKQFRDAIEAIPSTKDVTIRIKEIRDVSQEFSPGASVPDFTRQHGGPAYGLTWVGEGGKELVALPFGAQVFNSSESAQVLRKVEKAIGSSTVTTISNDDMRQGGPMNDPMGIPMPVPFDDRVISGGTFSSTRGPLTVGSSAASSLIAEGMRRGGPSPAAGGPRGRAGPVYYQTFYFNIYDATNPEETAQEVERLYRLKGKRIQL